MTFEARLKRLAKQAGVVAAAGIFVIIEIARCSGSPSTNWPSSQPHAFKLDSLDVLRATAGDLHIKAAWRLNAAGIAENMGIYQWSNADLGNVTMMCVTPELNILDCDKSAPKRFDINDVRACGFSSYEQDTGPCIFWPGCHICASRTPKIKGMFERLKNSARDAQAWEERYRHAANGGDTSGFSINRDIGLRAAARAGNPEAQSLSSQLD